MAKSIPAATMDAMLNYMAASTRMDVVSDVSTPTDLGNSLAHVSMAGGDFAIAQGDAGAGSRKLTMSAKTGVSVAAQGEPRHVCLSLAGALRLITTASGPELTIGTTVAFPSWKYELGVPT